MSRQDNNAKLQKKSAHITSEGEERKSSHVTTKKKLHVLRRVRSHQSRQKDL